MLRASLDRMVLAAYANMGTSRALCGVIAGSVIMFVGGVAPLVVNFLHGKSRWLRLLAIPGMWLGLTAVLTSFRGVKTIF